VKQAHKLLVEFDIDCWITFVRESEINGDPTRAFLLGADVTWHSAFILTRHAGSAAIVGIMIGRPSRTPAPTTR
jgi:hypothetical protein